MAGDHTKRDAFREHSYFWHWLGAQKYTKQIFIAGNHDNWLQEHKPVILEICPNAQYLCDSGTEFEGLKIWGMPWTTTFPGMNPHCKAFTKDSEKELQEYVEKIPEDIDILITHGPAHTVLDKTIDGRDVGHGHLYGYLKYAIRPKLHVFGHIHEGYGQIEAFSGCISVNASHVNEKYQPINPPIRIIL